MKLEHPSHSSSSSHSSYSALIKHLLCARHGPSPLEFPVVPGGQDTFRDIVLNVFLLVVSVKNLSLQSGAQAPVPTLFWWRE